MMNKLYIASVPIGNLKEASLLLLETFEKIKTIFCEDTRTTNELLQRLGIKNKPRLISCHKYNESKRVDSFITELNKHDVMLVSDAGYPTISDPGNSIVCNLIKENINIEVINGPTALIHAIIKSGFNPSKFSFLGFLDNRKHQQIKCLSNYKNLETVIIIYESVHRLFDTLDTINGLFANNQICVCKELTKKFETFWYGTPNKIITQLQQETIKGEFVILIDNNQVQNNIHENEEWKKKVDKLKEYNLTNKDILQIIGEWFSNISKKVIYNYILGKENE